jgi:hypothetical protein
MKYLMPWKAEWVTYVLSEINIFIMVCATSFFLLPRSRSLFLGVPGGNSNVEAANDNANDDEAVTVDDLLNAQLGWLAYQHVHERRIAAAQARTNNNSEQQEPIPTLPYDVQQDLILFEFPFNPAHLSTAEMESPSLRPLALGVAEAEKTRLDDSYESSHSSTAEEEGPHKDKPAKNSKAASSLRAPTPRARSVDSDTSSSDGEDSDAEGLSSANKKQPKKTRQKSKPSARASAPESSSESSDEEQLSSSARSHSSRSPRPL